jgi:hypothetical protein
MKISKADLAQLEKEGVQVSRKMGAQPAPKKKAKPRKKTPPAPPVKQEHPAEYAAMRASIAASDDLVRRNTEILTRNSAAIEEFSASIKKMEPRKASPYTFDLERDDDKLLKRVFARPGIVRD